MSLWAELTRMLIVSITPLCVGTLVIGLLPGTSDKTHKLCATIVAFLIAIPAIMLLIQNGNATHDFFIWIAQLISTYWRNIVFAIVALFIVSTVSVVIFGAAMSWKEKCSNVEAKPEDDAESQSATFEEQLRTENEVDRKRAADILAIDNYVRQLQKIKKYSSEEKMQKKISNLEFALLYVKQQMNAQPDLFEKSVVFLKNYMPTTIKLLVQYTKINQQRAKTENDKSAQMSIEKSIDMVLIALKKQLRKAREMNVMEVTAESEAMQNVLIMNGYINTEAEMQKSNSENALKTNIRTLE